uniref:Uncharacterized protein n=1 Tax=Rhizophora mucronata TaxID=61149 RepID=A0A2P2P4K2_RHIMU
MTDKIKIIGPSFLIFASYLRLIVTFLENLSPILLVFHAD